MSSAVYSPLITDGRGGVAKLDSSIDELSVRNLSSRTTQLSYYRMGIKDLIGPYDSCQKVGIKTISFINLLAFRYCAGLMSGDLQNFTEVGQCLEKPQYLCLIPCATEMIHLFSGLEQCGSILPSPHQLSKRLSKGSK